MGVLGTGDAFHFTAAVSTPKLCLAISCAIAVAVAPIVGHARPWFPRGGPKVAARKIAEAYLAEAYPGRSVDSRPERFPRTRRWARHALTGAVALSVVAAAFVASSDSTQLRQEYETLRRETAQQIETLRNRGDDDGAVELEQDLARWEQAFGVQRDAADKWYAANIEPRTAALESALAPHLTPIKTHLEGASEPRKLAYASVFAGLVAWAAQWRADARVLREVRKDLRKAGLSRDEIKAAWREIKAAWRENQE